MRLLSDEELLLISGAGEKKRDPKDPPEDAGDSWGARASRSVGQFFSGVGAAVSDCSSGASAGGAMAAGRGALVAGPVGAAAAGVVGAVGGCLVNTGVGVISAIGKSAGKSN